MLQKFHEIRQLSLHLYTANENYVFNAFKESPVLRDLIEPKYYTNSGENGKQFLYSLKRLAEKFPKLKSIQIDFVFVNDFSNLRQQLSPLKAFPELKRLCLGLIFLKHQNKFELSLMSFGELQNMTHLSLRSDVKLNEKN